MTSTIITLPKSISGIIFHFQFHFVNGIEALIAVCWQNVYYFVNLYIASQIETLEMQK
jgi:hypothetical protein